MATLKECSDVKDSACMSHINRYGYTAPTTMPITKGIGEISQEYINRLVQFSKQDSTKSPGNNGPKKPPKAGCGETEINEID